MGKLHFLFCLRLCENKTYFLFTPVRGQKSDFSTPPNAINMEAVTRVLNSLRKLPENCVKLQVTQELTPIFVRHCIGVCEHTLH